MLDARYVVVVTVLSSTLLTSCATNLGTCDENMLGGSSVAGSAKPNDGQVVVEKTCAGARCHSSIAKGKNRVGAPAGLNFDVLPMDTSLPELTRISNAAKVVHDKADSMWEEIDDGYMPPKNQGRMLSTTDKEALRNWLACGAPVIDAPVAAGTDWTSIYASLTSNGCPACHGATPVGNNFMFGPDACTAYKAVVNAPAAAGGLCAMSGLNLVVPMQPDMSLLLKKLEGTQPCGSAMPLGTAGLGPTNAGVMALRSWIMMGAPAPAGCM
jgi:hypothetical protein